VASSRGKTGQLSRNFTAHEFTCPHCGSAVVRPLLVARLEVARARIGRPIPIASGYRCPVHNIAVGGAADSQHMYGSAADIPSGLLRASVARDIFVGVGTKGDWAVHVDVRDGEKAHWTY